MRAAAMTSREHAFVQHGGRAGFKISNLATANTGLHHGCATHGHGGAWSSMHACSSHDVKGTCIRATWGQGRRVHGRCTCD